MAVRINNIAKEPIIPFFATVVSFEDQKENFNGDGVGWRYKIAIHGDTPTDPNDSISNSDLSDAYFILSNSDGSGGGGYSRSLRISQGDTVFGIKIGGQRGMNIVIGPFPRTFLTKYGGSDRSDPISGFTQVKKTNFLNQNVETNEVRGRCVARPIGSSKQNRQSPQ
jgi:hypothetical protein